MNLLTPPFDDVHVRKAMNYVMDKAGLVKAYGGSLHAVPATTVEPPTVNPATADYDPYGGAANNFAGDVNSALAEMKQSKYQTRQHGQVHRPRLQGLPVPGSVDAAVAEPEPGRRCRAWRRSA